MLNKHIKKVSIEQFNLKLREKIEYLRKASGCNISVYTIPPDGVYNNIGGYTIPPDGAIRIFLHKSKKMQAEKVNKSFDKELHELHRARLNQELVDRFKANKEVNEMVTKHKLKGLANDNT